MEGYARLAVTTKDQVALGRLAHMDLAMDRQTSGPLLFDSSSIKSASIALSYLGEEDLHSLETRQKAESGLE